MKESYATKLRSFSYIDPLLWNNIQCYLKRARSVGCFKVSLKTYLFHRYVYCICNVTQCLCPLCFCYCFQKVHIKTTCVMRYKIIHLLLKKISLTTYFSNVRTQKPSAEECSWRSGVFANVSYSGASIHFSDGGGGANVKKMVYVKYNFYVKFNGVVVPDSAF